MTRLKGENALITGGGTGLGRAIALAFAREGANVAVAGRRLDKLQEIVSDIERQGGSAGDYLRSRAAGGHALHG